MKIPKQGRSVMSNYAPLLNFFTLHNLCNNFVQGLRLGQAQRIICQLFMQRVILCGDFPIDDGL